MVGAEVKLSTVVPTFLTVTDSVALPEATVPKASVVGVRVTSVPVPVRPTSCGFVGSLLWMISSLFAAAPTAVGLKVTPITQLVVIAPVQVLLAMVYSALPLIVADVAE